MHIILTLRNEDLEYRYVSICSVFFENAEFYVEPKMLSVNEEGGVAVVKNRKVVLIDSQLQKVRLDNGWEIFYDRCLLATGKTSFSCVGKISLQFLKY